MPLGELATMGTGHTPSRGVSEYWGGDVPWLGIRDARNHNGGTIWETAQTITQAGLDNSSARLLPAGTIALSRTASVGYVVQFGRKMATSQDFVTWTCGQALEPLFVMRALQAEGDNIRAFGEGSTHTTIYFPELKALNLLTPPVAEQRRIVAKIDRLSAKSSRARDYLDRIPQLVEKYKRALLKANFEPLHNSGAKLSDLSEFVTSGSRGWAAYYSDIGPSFIRVANLRRGLIALDLSDVQCVSPPAGAEGTRTRVRPGDVVVTITADLGRVGVVDENLGEAYVNQHVALIRLHDPDQGRFVAWYLCSPEGQDQLLEQNRGVTRAGLGLDDIRNVDVPNVDREVQLSTIRRIETAFAWIDRLAAEAGSARALLDRLNQAILAKAFRGELVPQDPNDEPASVLLERIRAERAAAGPGPKRSRRPRAAPGA